jgi:hypothetical protein
MAESIFTLQFILLGAYDDDFNWSLILLNVTWSQMAKPGALVQTTPASGCAVGGFHEGYCQQAFGAQDENRPSARCGGRVVSDRSGSYLLEIIVYLP